MYNFGRKLSQVEIVYRILDENYLVGIAYGMTGWKLLQLKIDYTIFGRRLSQVEIASRMIGRKLSRFFYRNCLRWKVAYRITDGICLGENCLSKCFFGNVLRLKAVITLILFCNEEKSFLPRDSDKIATCVLLC